MSDSRQKEPSIRISGRIVTPDGIFDGTVGIEGGRIAEVRRGSATAGGVDCDFGRALVVPGLIDLHMHGLGEHLCFTAADLAAIAADGVARAVPGGDALFDELPPEEEEEEDDAVS